MCSVLALSPFILAIVAFALMAVAAWRAARRQSSIPALHLVPGLLVLCLAGGALYARNAACVLVVG